MARSLIREGQVVDEDFLSHTEHDDPNQSEVIHKFLFNDDVPSTYSGHGGDFIYVKEDESGLDFITLSGSGSISEEQIADWDSKEPGFEKNTAFNKDFGTTSGTICDGGDYRLSDSRTPTTHGSTHVDSDQIPLVVAGTTHGLMSYSDKSILDSTQGFKNKFINGNFDVWQRGTSQTAAGYGSVDRWRISRDSGSAVTLSRQTFSIGQTSVPNNPNYFVRLAVTAGVASNHYAIFEQRIEDVTLLSGKTCVVSFYSYVSHVPSFMSVTARQSFGTGGSPSAYVDVNPRITIHEMSTSWTKTEVVFDFPSVSGKTLGTDINSYTSIFFFLSAGTDLNTLTDSLGPQTLTFNIAQVQIEEGEFSTQFDLRPVVVEIALCERYYEMGLIRYNGDSTTGVTYWAWYNYRVRKRGNVSPAATGTNISVVGFPSAVGSLTPSGSNVVESRVCNSTGVSRVFNTSVTIDAEL